MAERVCPKCGSLVKAERSAIRLTLSCTECKWRSVKNVIKKGHG